MNRFSRPGSGWIEVVTGSMFSGKSEELIRRVRRAQIARQRVQIFKPQVDNRYATDHIVSHSEMKMPSQVVKCAQEILQRVDDRTEVVGIDEGQFFDSGLVAVANALADRGVRVVVAGLDQDFRRLPFGPMPELLSHAEFVDKLQAVCHRCGGPATTTQRLVDGEPALYSGDTVVVGAAEQYEARCRGCHEPGVGAELVAA